LNVVFASLEKVIKRGVFSTYFHCAPQPNCTFNADANTGHAFGIFMASVGALRASRSGAG
jgi:hypothetical protein